MKHTIFYSRIAFIAAILTFLAPLSALHAQQAGMLDVPRSISYQGLITSSDGIPVPDGEYDITVRLYVDPAGALAVWQDTYRTAVHGGIFNLYLGEGNFPLPASAEMNRPLWVGTTLNGMDEMRPLTPLTASPYALNLPDKAVTTGKLADGAVTAEKVEMEYIAGIAVNGEKISGKGTILHLQSNDDIALEYDESNNVLNIGRQKRGRISDPEKRDASVLAGTATDEVWSKTGDIWDISAGASVSPALTDWIGTSNNIPFTIKVNDGGTATGGNQRVMEYRPNILSANILGGHNSNAIGNGFGNIIAGGGANGIPNVIDNQSDYNTIGGGSNHNIVEDVQSATIGGGYHNTIGYNNSYATIAGGRNNGTGGVAKQCGTIGGGSGNSAINDYVVVGGGDSNQSSGHTATVGGGHANKASGDYATVSGGSENESKAEYTFTGGGRMNKVEGREGAIGGGRSNVIGAVGTDGNHSFIGGGENNTNYGSWSVVAGGKTNSIASSSATTYFSTIGGGELNSITSLHSVIAGGYSNTASGYNSTISGGRANTASGHTATIAGGYTNTVAALEGFIGAGNTNTITASADYAVITGGEGNTIQAAASHSVIAGGLDNEIQSSSSQTSPYTTISGGRNNIIGANGDYTTICGGNNNSATGSYSVIGGGDEHNATALNSTIAGGWDNTASASFATVGGGRQNVAGGNSSAIPGGDHLEAPSYAQSAVGFYNAPRGTVTGRPSLSVLATISNPLFMVGNGPSGAGGKRMNAFEVSYNGHSVVYDRNGSGSATSAIRGATYTDNVIYAWGTATPAPGIVTVDCDFGVHHIQWLGIGHYRVFITPIQPDGTPDTLSCGSVTATLAAQNRECAFINATPLNNNQFDVYISAPGISKVYGPGGVLTDVFPTCSEIDLPFAFKVTARPPTEY